MPRREVGSSNESLWRKRFVVLAAVLFPLLVLGGALAPQVVSVMLDESQLEAEEEYESSELNFDKPIPGMPPLSLPLEPLDFNTGSVSGLLDLQHLFTRTRFSADPMSLRFSRLLNFPRNHGDVIVMDDVDREIQEVLFKDPVMVGAITGDTGSDDDMFALNDPRPIGDLFTFDDPQGTGEGDPGQLVALPEPGSISLILLGLLVMACQRRFASPANR